MSLIKYIKRLEYSNYLIKNKATGDLNSFAKKIGLSKSAVRDLISQMREMGAEIGYNRSKKTYYYLEDGEICISKFIKYGQVIKGDDISKIGDINDLCFSETAIFVLCKEK